MVNEWRARYRKPVVLDEIAYEGNIQHGWGNISGEEMLRRFWEAVCRGGYPGHGETYLHPEDILYLFYYSFMCLSFREFYFDDDTEFSVRVLDTWNMTVEDKGVYKGKFRIELPERMYMAVQVKKAE
ncbi:DUF5605 domain-containing protein [Schaedlerella arabinosiphila]|uniref:DUF5605 domain-containing protein n=1 Tax=Schaedlerella arabinosiphila TaxID=2044587 RepID=UPI002557D07A|nr:DUF5605 domain-containing protein [Schaedlerella arabinosiphila]